MARRRGQSEQAETIVAGGRDVIIRNADGQMETRRQRTITAAAMVIDIKDRRLVKRLKSFRQGWQEETWAYYRSTPLVGFGADFVANALSRLRFYVAWQPSASEWPAEIDPDAPPEEMDLGVYETAVAIHGRLDQGQGHMEMARKAGYGLSLPGEIVVVGREEIDPKTGRKQERFDAFSTSEIDLSKADKGEISVKTTPTGLGGSNEDTFRIDPETAWYFRVWRPDPEYGQLAATPMQRVLEHCEEQALLRRYMRGTFRTRLNAGVFEVPKEWGMGPEDNFDENNQGVDRLVDKLVAAFMTPIEDEGSAAGVVPFVVHAPIETLGKARHITFGRDFDDRAMEMRRRLDEEIASGLDLPDQVLLGLGDVKFRNAEVITDEQFRMHLEPLAIVWVRALTVGFLHPMLIHDGVDPEVARQFTIWYDAAAITSDPDQTASSNFGFDRGLLSGRAWINANNYTEEDMPDDEELAARQDGLPWPIVKAPVPGQPPGGEPPVAPVAPVPPVVGPEAEALRQVAQAAALVAATQPRRPSRARPTVANLGRRLADSERFTRLKVQMAADQAMRRSFERMGAAVRQRAGSQAGLLRGIDNAAVVTRIGWDAALQMGLTPSVHLGLELGKLRDRFYEVIVAHQHQVVALIASAARMPVDQLTARSAASWARAVDHAWVEFEGQLQKLASDALFLSMVASGPRDRLVAAGPPPVELDSRMLGEFDATVTVPAGLVRDALSVAGGTTIPDERNPATLGGVAAGPIAGDLLAESGLGIEGYEWLYGDAATRTRPFEPHERLGSGGADGGGVIFFGYDDPVLANPDEFPPGPTYYPGDHSGCQCEQAQRIVETQPAVVDPVAPSELRRRGLEQAPPAEAWYAQSRNLGARPPVIERVQPVATVPQTETAVQQTLAIDLPRIDPMGWQWERSTWKNHVEAFMSDNFSGGALSTDTLESVDVYQGSGYTSINDSLRGFTNAFDSQYRDVTVRDHIAQLDNAISAHVLQEDQLFFRGVFQDSKLESLLAQFNAPGDVLSDHGFVSASASHEIAVRFDGMSMFEVEMPAGSPAMPMPRPTYEGEVLLPRGAKFEYVGQYVDDSGRTVYRVRFVGTE